MKAIRTSLIAAMALVLSAGALLASAYQPPTPSPVIVLRPSAQRVSLSLDQAVRMVQHRYRARVVRAETQMQGGRTIYVLRMLDDAGRVFAVRVDAASGSIL
ncbi:MAG: PepSY domain-containing protein [Gammaproteobacteria bacterium]|nr:PepSY domain-containing protein [Gammaproteobacteria bacterium]